MENSSNTNIKQTAKKPVFSIITISVLVVALAVVSYIALNKNQVSTETAQQNQKIKDENRELLSQVKKLETDKANATAKIATAPAAQTTPALAQATTDSNFRPNAKTIDDLKSILNTGDTRPFQSYAADRVTFYYYSANPSAVFLSKSTASFGLEPFIHNGVHNGSPDMTLNLSKATIQNYRAKSKTASKEYDKFFIEGCLAGHSKTTNDGSQSFSLISFCFNKSGKIHSVFIGKGGFNG